MSVSQARKIRCLLAFCFLCIPNKLSVLIIAAFVDIELIWALSFPFPLIVLA